MTTRPEIDVNKEGGVRCPLCDFSTTVKDSRPGTANSVRRRRFCMSSKCGHRFTTYEMPTERRALSVAALEIMLARLEQHVAGAVVHIDEIRKAIAAGKLLDELSRK